MTILAPHRSEPWDEAMTRRLRATAPGQATFADPSLGARCGDCEHYSTGKARGLATPHRARCMHPNHADRKRPLLEREQCACAAFLRRLVALGEIGSARHQHMLRHRRADQHNTNERAINDTGTSS